jgi:hypothetical protein
VALRAEPGAAPSEAPAEPSYHLVLSLTGLGHAFRLARTRGRVAFGSSTYLAGPGPGPSALVKAAGASQSVPNPDGQYPDPSGNFRGQVIANLAVGLAGGIPVGGTVAGTALPGALGPSRAGPTSLPVCTAWALCCASSCFLVLVVLMAASNIARDSSVFILSGADGVVLRSTTCKR